MTDFRHTVRQWLPPLAAVALIALFVSLAAWQLERADEKKALAALFDDDRPPADFRPGRDYELYQRVRASGRYLADRQILIDNIVQNSRLGYYVITPLETAADEPLLLVNRGFVPRQNHGAALPDIAVGGERRSLEGRVGRLPRVALRPSQAIEAGQDWPLLAVYPRLSDIAAALHAPVADSVLLLAPAADDGYDRQWQPAQKGPMMHYGYAFQWSALAVTVLVILVWQLRKRYRNG